MKEVRYYLIRFGKDYLSRPYYVTVLENTLSLVTQVGNAWGWDTAELAQRWKDDFLSQQKPEAREKFANHMTIEAHVFGSKLQ